MILILLQETVPEQFEEYQTGQITEIVLEQSKLLFSRDSPNYTEQVLSHRFNSSLENAYHFAAISFLAGVQNLFGIGGPRSQDQGLFELEQSHRYGCNEATLLLADGHMRGKYGLAKSEALAFGYYSEVAKGFLAGISDGDSYQYEYNKYYLDLFLNGMDKSLIDKSERQYMLINFLNRQAPDMSIIGNIISLGSYTGSFGFSEDEENSARFIFLAAADNVTIPLKADLNSYEAIEQHLRGENRYNEKIGEDFQDIENETSDDIFDKMQSFFKKFEILDGFEEMNPEQASKTNPSNIPSYLQRHAAQFDYEGINLLEYKDILPFTPNAYLDALIRLAKEACWDIYEDYRHFELFSELGENPTKNEVYELLLSSEGNLVMEAATMFIERTDQNPMLSHLRVELDHLRGDEADYVAAMHEEQEFTRSLTETCSRKGENFALLAVMLSKGVLIPTEFMDSMQNKALTRLMSLASVYHGCHMGLTSLGFWAVDGYRPGNITKYPNLNAALLAFDIASQAGSFESSYYESLILSHKMSAYCTRLRPSILYYFDSNFIAKQKDKFNPYHGIPKSLLLAASLAEHAAHAGYLEGQILKADIDYELGRKYQACEQMRRAVEFFAVDEFLEERERDIQGNFVFAFTGEETSLYNNLREHYKLNFPLCYTTRASETQCLENGALYLLLELSAGNLNPGIQFESSRICSRNSELCLEALFGFSFNYIEENRQEVLRFLEEETRTHAQEWAEAFLRAREVFQRRITPAQVDLDIAKSYFVTNAVLRTNKFETALSRCFFEDFDHEKRFAECLPLHYFLRELSGEYLREISATEMYDNVTMQHTKEMLEKYVELYNSFTFALAFKYFSPDLARLININQQKVNALRSAAIEVDVFEFLSEFVASDELDKGFEHAQALIDRFNGVGKTKAFTLTVNKQISENRSEWASMLAAPRVIGDFSQLNAIDEMFFVETLSFAALSVSEHVKTIIYTLLGIGIFNLAISLFSRRYRPKKNNPAIDNELDKLLGEFEFGDGFENDIGK